MQKGPESLGIHPHDQGPISDDPELNIDILTGVIEQGDWNLNAHLIP